MTGKNSARDRDRQRFRQEVIVALSACIAATDQEQQAGKTLAETLERIHTFLGEFSGFRDCLHPPSPVGVQPGKPAGAFSDDEAAWLGTAGRLARRAFEPSTSPSHRKQYGQFFTPVTISALACAAAIRPTTTSIIDPMCGTGAMLWAALDRLACLGKIGQVSITGVELDPLAARIAALPPAAHQARGFHKLQVLRADAFLELTDLLSNCSAPGHSGRYDAIVGNPPYVRYQSFTSMFQDTNPEIMDTFRRELPKASDSAVADTIIRAGLIAHLVNDRGDGVRGIAREAIAMLRSQTLSKVSNPVEACWVRLVTNYSGLADLSLPSWLLTWRLARPGAIIAYITTASWKSRQYARLLRYFMLRMLQPLLIVEQDLNWFDALIPTSLMVLRARPPQEAAIPLQERRDSQHKVRIVQVNREHDLADPATFRRVALGLDPNCVADPQLELTACADTIIQAIERQEQDIENDLWTINLTSEWSLVEALFREDAAARRSGSRGSTLQALEGTQKQPGRRVQMLAFPQTVLPNTIQQSLGLTRVPPQAFRLLADYGVDVNQGLRTGCNPFFYIRRLTAQDWEEWLPNESPVQMAAALARPGKHPEQFLTMMAKLRRVNAFIADEPPSECPPSMLVKLDKVFGERLAVLPMSVLEPTVRYQRTLTRWTISDPQSLPDYALVTGSGATPQDHAELAARYPERWINTWKTRDGLSVLPSGLTRYILLAAKTPLKRAGQMVRIPELSAVAPNAHQPPRPVNRTLFTEDEIVPGPPTWWYTLPLQPRHTGLVFMARVNAVAPRAYLNSVTDPALIDANFSTFSFGAGRFSAEALFAFLNSTWVEAVLEATATPMGGGALKVEAAHLRVLSVPDLDKESTLRLGELGQSLVRLSKSDDASDVLWSIDRVVMNKMSVILNLDAAQMLKTLETLSNDLRQRRNRR
jgi:hypothetical protein